MGCRQNRTAHRCQGVPGSPAPATGRSAAHTRAARPRCHRRSATTVRRTALGTPVHEPPQRVWPDFPSQRGPGPPSPAPLECRPRRRPAPPAPTWRTAAPRDLLRPNLPPATPTTSARQRSAQPADSHPADPAAPLSTIRTTPNQHRAPTTDPSPNPPASRPKLCRFAFARPDHCLQRPKAPLSHLNEVARPQ